MSEFNDEDIIMPDPYNRGASVNASVFRQYQSRSMKSADEAMLYTAGVGWNSDYYTAEYKGKGTRGDPYELRRRIR